MTRRASPPDIITFIKDPEFLGPDDLISVPQVAVLKAIYGLSMKAEELDAFLEISDGAKPRKGGYSEAVIIAGRRSGKTEKILANIAVYEGFVFDASFLTPGEDAYFPIVAQDVDGAMRARGYIEGKLHRLQDRGWPVFDEGEAQEKAITGKQVRCLKRLADGTARRLIYQCFPCNKASVRGLTSIGWGADEIAFWRTDEGAYNPDTEVIRALRATSVTAGRWPKKIIVSTPYAEEGVLWEAYQERHKARRLVVQAPTWTLNPNVDKEELETQRIDDPVGFMREFGAQFGKAGGTYLTVESVDKCLDKERPEIIPPQPGRQYFAALDVAFKHDLYVLGLGHGDDQRAVMDLIHTWQGSRKAPLDGAATAAEASEDLRAYGLDVAVADQYCDVQVVKDFAACGITVRIEPQTEEGNFEMFKNLKAVMNRGLVSLPDLPIVKKDLLSLRSFKSARRFRVAAPDRKGFHDDISKVVAVLLMRILPIAGVQDTSDLNARAAPERTQSPRMDWRDPDKSREFEHDIMGARF